MAENLGPPGYSGSCPQPDNMADADNREEEDVREGITSTTVTGVTVTVTSDSPQPPRAPEASPRPPVVEKTSVKVAFSQFSSL